MTPPTAPGIELVAVANGVADVPDRSLFRPDLRTTVRYADPAAWLVATAVGRALSTRSDPLTGVTQRCGVLVTSDHGPKETMVDVGAAALTGFSSALRYPAANPGSLAGVSCIAFGFQGPTLTFLMPVVTGVPVCLRMATAWLARGMAPYVIASSCQKGSSGKLQARCLVLAVAESHREEAIQGLEGGPEAWLTGRMEERG